MSEQMFLAGFIVGVLITGMMVWAMLLILKKEINKWLFQEPKSLHLQPNTKAYQCPNCGFSAVLWDWKEIETWVEILSCPSCGFSAKRQAWKEIIIEPDLKFIGPKKRGE